MGPASCLTSTSRAYASGVSRWHCQDSLPDLNCIRAQGLWQTSIVHKGAAPDIHQWRGSTTSTCRLPHKKSNSEFQASTHSPSGPSQGHRFFRQGTLVSLESAEILPRENLDSQVRPLSTIPPAQRPYSPVSTNNRQIDHRHHRNAHLQREVAAYSLSHARAHDLRSQALVWALYTGASLQEIIYMIKTLGVAQPSSSEHTWMVS
jgi:hypothetical protein